MGSSRGDKLYELSFIEALKRCRVYAFAITFDMRPLGLGSKLSGRATRSSKHTRQIDGRPASQPQNSTPQLAALQPAAAATAAGGIAAAEYGGAGVLGSVTETSRSAVLFSSVGRTARASISVQVHLFFPGAAEVLQPEEARFEVGSICAWL